MTPIIRTLVTAEVRAMGTDRPFDRREFHFYLGLGPGTTPTKKAKARETLWGMGYDVRGLNMSDYVVK